MTDTNKKQPDKDDSAAQEKLERHRQDLFDLREELRSYLKQ